jgi:hypothetical protein
MTRSGRHLWNHLLEHGRVAFQQLKPRLAGTLPDTTGQDYDFGPVQVSVIARTDPDWRGKRRRVEYIFGLRFCQLRVQIDEYNLVGHAAERDGISGTTAAETTANNTDFMARCPTASDAAANPLRTSDTKSSDFLTPSRRTFRPAQDSCNGFRLQASYSCTTLADLGQISLPRTIFLPRQEHRCSFRAQSTTSRARGTPARAHVITEHRTPAHPLPFLAGGGSGANSSNSVGLP